MANDNSRLVALYKKVIDNESEWANRMKIFRVVHGVLVDYPDGNWEIELSGSMVYGCADRDADIDFAVVLKEKDDTTDAAIVRFEPEKFCRLVSEATGGEDLYIFRVKKTNLPDLKLIRIWLTTLNDPMRTVQVDISFGSDGYRTGHYFAKFKHFAPFCFLTIMVKRILTVSGNFGSRFGSMNGITLASLVLDYLKGKYNPVSNGCRAFGWDDPIHPSIADISHSSWDNLNGTENDFYKLLLGFLCYLTRYNFREYAIDIVNQNYSRDEFTVPIFIDNSAFGSNINVANRLQSRKWISARGILGAIVLRLESANRYSILDEWSRTLIPRRI